MFEGGGDLDLGEIADAEGGVGFHQDFVVDFGGVVLGACDEVVAFLSVDEDAEGAADFFFVQLLRDCILNGHEFVDALFFRGVVDGVAEGKGRGVFFGGVGKDAEAVEASGADEVLEFVESCLVLAGVAHDQGGADGHAGDHLPHFVQEGQCAFAVDAAVHGVENAAVDVLEWDVDVFADIRVAGNSLNGVEWEGGWVGVVEPDPFGAGLGGEAFEEGADAPLAVEVDAVVGCILSNNNQFFNAVVHHAPRLVEDFLDRARDVVAADGRDGAVAAAAVAAFGNLEVGVVLGGALEAFRLEAVVVFGFEAADELAPLRDAVEGIDFRQLGLQFLAVAFHEAANGDHAAAFPATLLDADLLEEHIDRLLFGVVDETASVDDNNIAVVAFAIKKDLETGLFEMACNMFGISNIL